MSAYHRTGRRSHFLSGHVNTNKMAAPGGENEDVRGKTSPEPGKLEFSLDVPFPTAREAEVALGSLSPDREPRKGGISKRLSVSGSTLSVRCQEKTPRTPTKLPSKT
ncbi:unnamed protein product [Pleuronectes platessa]|uniref:Uncharacterized protein n=1 Tax=Pleuronectes platessa TaxID=8262 RepID=A0A9N7UKU9_PLEPL|nr:unnamed protein product [Pleuronectes platessa]